MGNSDFVQETMTRSAANARLANVEELRSAVASDKRRALEVVEAARAKQSRPIISPIDESNEHPRPKTDDFLASRQELRIELGIACSTPFFARVDVQFADEEAPIALLISKARVAGEIYKDNEWELISFTSPLYASVLDRDIGSAFSVSAKCRGVLGPSARFGAVSPEIRAAHYRCRSGDAYVSTDSELSDPRYVPRIQRPNAVYTAAGSLGLEEIIELADNSQRSAMHLPFVESVLVEGPPGSGKTSVGIMRVPCLLDRQWKELSLEQGRDPPFHTPDSMRILVMNEQMVGYLIELVRSLRIDGVGVTTIGDLLLRVCENAGLLRGPEGTDEPILAKFKSTPYVLQAFWAGFRRRVHEVFATQEERLLLRLESIGDSGKDLANRLRVWLKNVESITVQDSILPSTVHLARICANWQQQAQRNIPERERLSFWKNFSKTRRDHVARVNAERAKQIEAIRSIQVATESLLPTLCDFVKIARSMFATPEFADAVSRFSQDTTPTQAAQAESKWREQMNASQPVRTEYDAVLAAWLAVHLSLLPADQETLLIGGRLDRFTHLMVDEAQDLSSTHSVVLQKLIFRGGTLTLVGDLRQRLSPIGGLRSWSDLYVPNIRRAAFVVNYRQSFELGRFVMGLHQALFDEKPVWRPAESRTGPIPTVRIEASDSRVHATVASEVRRWRAEIPRATVGVLLFGRWHSQQATLFRERLAAVLSESLVNIVGVGQDHSDASLHNTNCVIVAPVAATRGLEFDAVIVLDAHAEWSVQTAELSLRRKHELYVATSRAKQGLSIVVKACPQLLITFAKQGLCRCEGSQQTYI